MKRALTLFLCAVMLVTALCGCTTLQKDSETGEYDKGAIIPMYLGTEMYNFDPAIAYLNDSNAKILSLLYAKLTDIDKNGKMKLTLIDSWSVSENEQLGEYKMKIKLKNTKWSDGVALQASDVVFAWKRILKVNFDCEAACLLFDIKNARDVKSGIKTIDDLGVTAPETLVVEVEFERKIDYEQFLRNLSSLALVPLRESVVSRSADWAKRSNSIVTSGPFVLKSVSYGNELRLERSNYYFLNTEKNEYMDKYVIPFRIKTNYSKDLSYFTSGLTTDSWGDRVFYTNEIPLDQRKDYLEYVDPMDIMSTHTYYLNLNNPLFSDARVRQALSLAIDRKHIAEEIVVFAKPATGFIPYKVNNGSAKSSFREAGGDILETTANVDKAKQLLSDAGVSSGDIIIRYYANDQVSAAVASYVAEAWSGLGFNARALPVSATQVEEDTIYVDNFHNLYSADSATDGAWDVLAIDYQSLSEQAFSSLAPFAVEFSGNGVDMTNDEYPATGHLTGYASEEYNALIEAAYEETDPAKRTEKLHEAEKKLLEDMPIIPIIFNQEAHLIDDSVVSGFSYDYYNMTIFNRVKMSNYMDWKPYFEDVIKE